MTDREKFEKMADSLGFDLDTLFDQTYADSQTRKAWKLWQAAISSRDSTPTEGVGKQIVDVALSIHGTNIIRDEYPVTLKDIENRIDRALAVPRMTLDLTKAEGWDSGLMRFTLSGSVILSAIRQQLPNVEVVTE